MAPEQMRVTSEKKTNIANDIMAVLADNARSNTLSSYVYLNENVRHGLPLAIAEQNRPVVEAMVNHNILPRKTWENAKKSKSKRLTPQNSERLLRTLRIVELAKMAFGDDLAIEWVERPTSVFEGKPPIKMLTNESGSRAVELFLMRTMHGFNA